MRRLLNNQRCRRRFVFTSGLCLFVYIAILVALHNQLAQVVFVPFSANTTKSANNATTRFLYLLFASHLQSSTSEVNSTIYVDESFLNPYPVRRSSVAFPLIYGCPYPTVDRQRRSSGSGFQSIGHDFFYAAYVDDRLQPSGPSFIRVFALLRRRSNGEAFPKFYVETPSNRSVVAPPLGSKSEAAVLYEMCENHKRRYGGWIVSWQLPRYKATIGRSLGCSIEVIARSDSESTSSTDRVSIPLFKMSRRHRRRWRADSKHHQRPKDDDFDHQTTKTGSDSEVFDDRLDFVVCVPPLFGDVSAATVVQFVELNRLLGVDHFVFYILERQRQSSHHQWSSIWSSVHPVSEAVRTVLDRYIELGVVTAITWELPDVVVDSVWYSGQLIAANDCLYRTSHAFRHVIFNDLDEFIIPHRSISHSDPSRSTSSVNWTQMIDELRRRTRISADGKASLISPSSSVSADFLSRLTGRIDWLIRPFQTNENHDVNVSSSSSSSMTSPKAHGTTMPCGYSFQSAFFTPVSWTKPLPPSMSDFVPSFDFLASIRRSQFSRVRTKVMVRPEAVFEVGIHHVSRPLFTLPSATDGSSSSSFRHVTSMAKISPLSHGVETRVISVPPDVGLVHHYRHCMTNFDAGMDCSEAMFVVDDGVEQTGHIPALKVRVQRVLDAFLPRPATPGDRVRN